MTLRVFLIAGEASGDFLAANAMRALQERTDQPLEFLGIGGDEMLSSGLERSLFPMEELSLMGVSEIVPHIPHLLKRIKQTAEAIVEVKPDLVLTVDAPDFVFRVSKRVKKTAPNIKIIHYVAPTVWAWRPGRAKKIAKFLDHILCLFPFEPPYFEKVGLSATFVGHPLVDRVPEYRDDLCEDFIRRHGLNASHSTPRIALLPGSRKAEIKSLLPIFLKSLKRIKSSEGKEFEILLPTLKHRRSLVEDIIEGEAKDLRDQITITDNSDDKYTVMYLSDLALHASGTVALELAMTHTPMITLYKASFTTGLLAKLLMKSKYANLVNILHDQEVVPELILSDATVDNTVEHLKKMISDNSYRESQVDKLKSIRGLLKPEAGSPAEAIAKAIIQLT